MSVVAIPSGIARTIRTDGGMARLPWQEERQGRLTILRRSD
jgi:hypothetical protein